MRRIFKFWRGARSRWRVIALVTFLLTAIFLFGCTGPSTGHEEGLIERLEHESAHAEKPDIDIELLLLEVESVQVKSDLEIPFHTLARTDQIQKYPCSTCHENGLESDKSSQLTEPHKDIELNHADPSVMSCTTCHAAENLDNLHTLTGTPVEFNHSYQVCSQCHSQEFEDWEGGAHGKRVGGWAPPRVIETCTSCHNPHDPAWDTRWPAVTGGGISEQE